jgi:hypothetical protein
VQQSEPPHRVAGDPCPAARVHQRIRWDAMGRDQEFGKLLLKKRLQSDDMLLTAQFSVYSDVLRPGVKRKSGNPGVKRMSLV